MQLAGKTARTVEALHVLVLILFSAFMPFCFKDAVPEEALAGLGTSLAGDNSTFVLPAVPEARPAEEPVLPPPPYEVEGLASGTDKVGAQDVKTAGSASRNGEARCEGGEDQARLSMLPFLIALIGGGVFSLEAFEAFPML